MPQTPQMKLQLHRETIRHLNAEDLEHVAAGDDDPILPTHTASWPITMCRPTFTCYPTTCA